MSVAAESCYCVCHSSFSSRAWCEHCKGDNEVGRVPRCKVPDDSNAFGTCARALPCAVHNSLLGVPEGEQGVRLPPGDDDR